MIIILFLAVYRVAAFSVRFHMEHWPKPITMKNLCLEMGWNWTLTFHMEPLGSIWNSKNHLSGYETRVPWHCGHVWNLRSETIPPVTSDHRANAGQEKATAMKTDWWVAAGDERTSIVPPLSVYYSPPTRRSVCWLAPFNARTLVIILWWSAAVYTERRWGDGASAATHSQQSTCVQLPWNVCHRTP